MNSAIHQQRDWPPSFIGEPSTMPARAQTPPPETRQSEEFTLFGDDGFSFGDVVDMINPLQHIPVVSTFYRAAIDDEISPAPRVMGSTLFFGPLGLVAALGNIIVEQNTGMDIGEHVASWVTPADASDSTDKNEALAFNNNAATRASQPQKPDPNDPVIAWARQEHQWARGNVSEPDSPAKAPKAKTEPSLPDAGAFIAPRQADPQRRAALPDERVSAVVLSADSRSASWAYEAAANLGGRGRRHGPG